MLFPKTIPLNSKWLFGALLLFTAVLGSVFGQYPNEIPNQEIILQFSNEDISTLEAQSTIAIVEQELQRAGIDDIYVREQQDGKLIISYYSRTTVAQIKKLLVARKELALGLLAPKDQQPFQFPVQENAPNYNLDVYEIQNGDHSFSNLGGKCAVELKSGQFRFLNPNFYVFTDEVRLAKELLPHKIDPCFPRYVALANDFRTHKIPEVRAGPLS